MSYGLKVRLRGPMRGCTGSLWGAFHEYMLALVEDIWARMHW